MYIWFENKVYAFCIFVGNDCDDQLSVDDCLNWIRRQSPELTSLRHRRQLPGSAELGRQAHNTSSLPSDATSWNAWIFAHRTGRPPPLRKFKHQPFDGHWIMMWIYGDKMAGQLWFWTYDWSLAWPITFKKNNIRLWIKCYTVPCFL